MQSHCYLQKNPTPIEFLSSMITLHWGIGSSVTTVQSKPRLTGERLSDALAPAKPIHMYSPQTAA